MREARRKEGNKMREGKVRRERGREKGVDMMINGTRARRRMVERKRKKKKRVQEARRKEEEKRREGRARKGVRRRALQ